MSDKFLKHAYSLENAKATEAFYRDWAKSYDEDIIENGYETPRRCAEALARFADDFTAPLLDIGCGTGLSGMAFAANGFTNQYGNDLCQDMITIAKDRDIYKDIQLVDLNNPLDFKKGHYRYIAAVGVVAVGHAPASTIKDVISKLDEGGLFVFSLNDPTLKDGSYEPVIDEAIAADEVTLLSCEYGTHLPKFGMKSKVFVLQKKRANPNIGLALGT